MSHELISRAELEQRRLLQLNGYIEGTLQYIHDGKCAYCAIRPITKESGPLCDVCVERRTQLAARYPEITIERLKPRSPAPTEGASKIQRIDREWVPYKG